MAKKDGNKEAGIAIIRPQQKAQVTAQLSDSRDRGVGDDDDVDGGIAVHAGGVPDRGVGDDDDGGIRVHAGGVPAIKRVGARWRDPEIGN